MNPRDERPAKIASNNGAFVNEITGHEEEEKKRKKEKKRTNFTNGGARGVNGLSDVATSKIC